MCIFQTSNFFTITSPQRKSRLGVHINHLRDLSLYGLIQNMKYSIHQLVCAHWIVQYFRQVTTIHMLLSRVSKQYAISTAQIELTFCSGPSSTPSSLKVQKISSTIRNQLKSINTENKRIGFRDELETIDANHKLFTHPCVTPPLHLKQQVSKKINPTHPLKRYPSEHFTAVPVKLSMDYRYWLAGHCDCTMTQSDI